jgi:hypothetical protein
MKISDIVFQNYQGIRRYGVVTQMLARGKWSYARVEWFNDEKYETAMDFLSQMRGGSHYYNEYRVDSLKVIDVKHEVDTMKKCANYADIL